jgi:glycosyltransferase involved in cell wall biosynthesis
VVIGLPGRKIVVVPNGIDCDAFHPDAEGRARLRAEWSVPPEAPLIGMVARLDPVKGHPTFLRAAARVAASRPGARFVCVGEGQASYRDSLLLLASEVGIADRLVWAGERRVTSAVYNALDVAVLASNAGESFPNVVAEAMACGTPCVVTESGDSPLIVGDTGAVAPPRDPEALARAILSVLERVLSDRTGTSAKARDRVMEEFSVERLVTRTERALELVKGGG